MSNALALDVSLAAFRVATADEQLDPVEVDAATAAQWGVENKVALAKGATDQLERINTSRLAVRLPPFKVVKRPVVAGAVPTAGRQICRPAIEKQRV